MTEEKDYLVPTTVLLRKSLKDRAKIVAPEYGGFSKLINEGLENEVVKLEFLKDSPVLEKKAS